MPRSRQRTSSTLQDFLFVVSFELPELTSLPTLSRASLRPPLERLQQALASHQRLRRALAWEMGMRGRPRFHRRAGFSGGVSMCEDCKVEILASAAQHLPGAWPAASVAGASEPLEERQSIKFFSDVHPTSKYCCLSCQGVMQLDQTCHRSDRDW